ncbi:hypothetical protein DL96DRAFT_1589315 [Flagelloscypha sp. PMI_526]|nr:hypothetical protein DL96DRAFT_1589315 [Flagelloscypha sp. PMI_526]
MHFPMIFTRQFLIHYHTLVLEHTASHPRVIADLKRLFKHKGEAFFKSKLRAIFLRFNLDKKNVSFVLEDLPTFSNLRHIFISLDGVYTLDDFWQADGIVPYCHQVLKAIFTLPLESCWLEYPDLLDMYDFIQQPSYQEAKSSMRALSTLTHLVCDSAILLNTTGLTHIAIRLEISATSRYLFNGYATTPRSNWCFFISLRAPYNVYSKLYDSVEQRDEAKLVIMKDHSPMSTMDCWGRAEVILRETLKPEAPTWLMGIEPDAICESDSETNGNILRFIL